MNATPKPLTSRDAWELLGCDPRYEPKRMQDKAGQRVLFLLNALGKLQPTADAEAARERDPNVAAARARFLTA